MAEKSSRPDLDWQFIILDSDSTNALAAPGGFIHITRGALAVIAAAVTLLFNPCRRHQVERNRKIRGLHPAYQHLLGMP